MNNQLKKVKKNLESIWQRLFDVISLDEVQPFIPKLHTVEQALEELETLRKKETQIKITEETRFSPDEWWGRIYKCPKCGGKNIWNFFKYCPDCGQKIELKVENND